MSSVAVTPVQNFAYFIRTGSVDSEGRVARFFSFLESHGGHCEMFAVVKKQSEFSFDCRQYISFSERIRFGPLRHISKLVDVQVTGLRYFLKYYRDADVIFLANHEFLFLGLTLRFFFRKRVIIDLHEHYYERLFRKQGFSRWFFTKLFSGVIFANVQRAEDFLGPIENSDCVSIVRNLPDVPKSMLCLPHFTSDRKLQIGLVGAAIPGRFVRESIRALDNPSIAKVAEIKTFGPETMEKTNHIQLFEHGRFSHDEIDVLTESLDVSLVFYDPDQNGNHLYCEPNRYFQAYNAGKFLISFHHESLKEFFDGGCFVISKTDFETALIKVIDKICRLKQVSQNDEIETFTREVANYRDSIKNETPFFERD